MAQFIQITAIGRVGGKQDPKLQVTPTEGTPYIRFSLAVDQSKGLPSLWFDVVCWSQLAEWIAPHLFKGAQVFVQGKLQRRPYKHNGVERIAEDIIATSVQVLEKRPKKGEVDELPDEVLPAVE